uniref:Uncharacterized protein n=1 Tax=Lactuca sativa TaxID=4236 RepID=A0A9R1X1V3_LACSA|nr:hypothetical protein LSAT_V11C700376080 [Lactuca sativa]
MNDCGLQTKKFLCGDTPTRWNSTFELLKSAYELREAFIEFGIRVPENYDFEVVTEMVKFFEKFKTKTELVSATSKPLVNLFIRDEIRQVLGCI